MRAALEAKAAALGLVERAVFAGEQRDVAAFIDLMDVFVLPSRDEPFVFDAGEPPVLLGNNEGANPVEYALKALASCLTTSMVFHATARGIELEGVRARLEGDLDMQGFLDLNENVRNGYEGIRVTFEIDGDFTDEQKEELCQLAQSRSPVFDIISNPVPVEVRVADA